MMNFLGSVVVYIQTFVRPCTSIKESWHSSDRFLVSFGWFSSLFAFLSKYFMWISGCFAIKWCTRLLVVNEFVESPPLGTFALHIPQVANLVSSPTLKNSQITDAFLFTATVDTIFNYNEQWIIIGLGCIHIHITCMDIVLALNVQGNLIPIMIWNFRPIYASPDSWSNYQCITNLLI